MSENIYLTAQSPQPVSKIDLSPWGIGGVITLVFAICSGFVYIAIQYWILSDIADPFFVGILIGTTFAIYRFAKFLRAYVCIFETRFDLLLREHHGNFAGKRIDVELFGSATSFVFAIGFGGIIGGVVWFLSPWDYFCLNLSLSVFLFLANTITGLAVYSIMQFIRLSQTISRTVTVSLWDRSNSLVIAMLEISRYVVLATAFAASMGTLSIMFSVFDLNLAIGLFSAFSLLMVATVYFVPLYPLMLRIREIKKNNLCEIERKIQKEYEFAIASQSTKGTDINLDDFHTLFELRKKILSVRTTAIAGTYSIATAIPIIFLTMLPSMIDYTLTIFG